MSGSHRQVKYFTQKVRHWHCAVEVKVTLNFSTFKNNTNPSPITQFWYMVRELKHVVVYENILDEFDVRHCGIKVKVTIALVKLNHLIFQITS